MLFALRVLRRKRVKPISRYVSATRTVGTRLFIGMAMLLGLGSPVFGAADKPDKHIQVKAVPVTGNISMLIGVGGFAGGNVGVSAGEDGILIVDDQLTPFSKQIEQRLSELKICSDCGSLSYLINTHWHFDHVGGNAYFGDQATIIAHENVRKILAAPSELKAFDMRFDASSKQALPEITYKDSVSIHFNGEEIKVIHLPNGHTDGDSIIYFTESNVLHLGDHFFNRIFAFIDLEHGGNVVGLTKNIASVLEMFPADVKIIPGHGELANMDDLKAYHRMLVETTRIVKERMDAGKSLDQILQEGLPDEWKAWEWQFVDRAGWIKLVHGSLKQ